MQSKNRKRPEAKYLGKATKNCPCLDVPATCRSSSAGHLPVSLVISLDQFHEAITASSLSNTGMPSLVKDKARPWLTVSGHLTSTSPHYLGREQCAPEMESWGTLLGPSVPLLPTAHKPHPQHARFGHGSGSGLAECFLHV